MKQNFDNAGFANVQASILNLPLPARLVATDQLRTDMDGWMLQTFDLSSSQQVELTALSPAFKQHIADAVADSWDAGRLILFDKQVQEEEASSRTKKSPKDVLIEKMSATSQNVQTQDLSKSQQVSIRVQYR